VRGCSTFFPVVPFGKNEKAGHIVEQFEKISEI
jgi:hypothetical protein